MLFLPPPQIVSFFRNFAKNTYRILVYFFETTVKNARVNLYFSTKNSQTDLLEYLIAQKTSAGF